MPLVLLFQSDLGHQRLRFASVKIWVAATLDPGLGSSKRYFQKVGKVVEVRLPNSGH